MKIATSYSPPQRRTIFLENRLQMEYSEALLRKKELKRGRAQQREERRKKFAASPLGKFFSGIGSLLWTVVISLLLTLLACYLVMNPQAFESLVDSAGQLFSVSIAGAAPPASDYQTQTVTAELKVEKDMDARFLDDEEAIMKQLGIARDHSERGHRGTLSLERVEVTPVLEVHSRKVNRSKEFRGLPTNDLAQLPQVEIFELRSKDALDEMADASLQAAEWQWSVEEHDEHNLPTSYTAQVTFRGEEKWLDYSHLEVTAHYSGELSKQVPVPVVNAPAMEDPTEDTPAQRRSPRTSIAAPLFAVNEPIILEPEVVDEELSEPEIALPVAFLDEVVPATEPRQDPRKRHYAIAGTILAASAAAAASGAAVVYYKKRKKTQSEH